MAINQCQALAHIAVMSPTHQHTLFLFPAHTHIHTHTYTHTHARAHTHTQPENLLISAAWSRDLLLRGVDGDGSPRQPYVSKFLLSEPASKRQEARRFRAMFRAVIEESKPNTEL